MRLGLGEHLHGRTLLGSVIEGKDFDFFHELVVSYELARIGIDFMSTRGIVEECLKWCDQRIVFKRRLVDQPVIGSKLAKMIASVEAAQAWLE
ncbi:uncharacterized protein BKA55DRAFT_697504 [Fusarium redolens]|uniref:Acyl-CoA dehydrogenase/oxidase C-terminal domain-containing protein n=1 Tax=Fusarium redolens TaxID=48865 RepID=A0A9P9JL55_FUSRE|nr:uncharacterized protein BKA55DRAFT_697504 [Fusarium redolens]KAH7220452.1 hypothetical protein BKA55DRAFT_697504 [Fusarium redolens]